MTPWWIYAWLLFAGGFCLGSFFFRKIEQLCLDQQRSIGWFEGNSEAFEHHAWRAHHAFNAGRLLRYDHVQDLYTFIGSSTPDGAWKTCDEAFQALWLHQSEQGRATQDPQ